MITLECAHCGALFESVRRSKKYCCCACANTASANKRSQELHNRAEKIVWSSGGGVQSTAIAALIYKGVLPKPDYAVMIDTGYESEKTIQYIHDIIIPKMAEVGVRFELVPTTRYGSADILDKNGGVNIPAFQKHSDGRVSKFSTRCNNSWKVKILHRYLREHGVTKCIDWVGISTDEARRGYKNTGLKWITNKYPLLDLGYSRDDCIKIIKEVGWPVPVRTSCIFCPLRTNYEWLRLKYENPADFERACEIEDYIRSVRPDVYLNSACRSLGEVLESE